MRHREQFREDPKASVILDPKGIAMGAVAALRNGWRMLGMPPKELRLENTLPTGLCRSHI